jgi:hypothetical protein
MSAIHFAEFAAPAQLIESSPSSRSPGRRLLNNARQRTLPANFATADLCHDVRPMVLRAYRRKHDGQCTIQTNRGSPVSASHSASEDRVTIGKGYS